MDTANLTDLTEEELQKRWDTAVEYMEKRYRFQLTKWVSIGSFAGFALGVLAGMGILWING